MDLGDGSKDRGVQSVDAMGQPCGPDGELIQLRQSGVVHVGQDPPTLGGRSLLSEPGQSRQGVLAPVQHSGRQIT